MIHEFAVEPELIFEWAAHARDIAYFTEAFGLGRPRILSIYPKDWRRRAAQYGEAEYQKLKRENPPENHARIDMHKKRFDALLSHFMDHDVYVKRAHLQFANKEWLDNAVDNAPNPFYAILARVTHSNSQYVLARDDVYDHERWKIERTRMVPRNPQSIASAVKLLLLGCKSVTFVDPYFFRPSNPTHLDVLREFLRIMSERKGPRPQIEVWCSDKPGHSWKFFREKCLSAKLDRELNDGWTIRVQWYRDKTTGGEQVHNRYVLTDIGGVTLGTGLDSGWDGSHDDISLMERNHCEQRRRQYSVSTTAFEVDPIESFTINGTGGMTKR